jgi:quercetin dioxygenase-like cupin family protein
MDEDLLIGTFSALPIEAPFPGVRRSAFSSLRATVTTYWFEPGARFPIHRHPEEQITLIEEGDVEFTIGDEVHALAAGAWSVVAGDVEHGITAGAQGARFVAIVSPPRRSSDAYSVVGDRETSA